jgi:ribosomal protein S18 acetylase RimI-like enzyme
VSGLNPPRDATVRAAAVADAESIAGIHMSAWRTAYAGLLPADLLSSLDVGQRAAAWTRQIESATTFVLVLERAGIIRGFVAAGPSRDADRPEAGEIYAIYMDPGWQGGGGGSQLLTTAIRRLAADGFTQATLWVLAGNAAARGFYESRGWRPDGAGKQETFGGQPSTEVRYVRET